MISGGSLTGKLVGANSSHSVDVRGIRIILLQPGTVRKNAGWRIKCRFMLFVAKILIFNYHNQLYLLKNLELKDFHLVVSRKMRF